MNRYFLLFLACGVMYNIYADPEEIGYVISGYGNPVKSAYGNCVHTAYYSADLTAGKSGCGDLKAAASAPTPTTVVVAPPPPKIVTQTVTISDADKVLFEFDQAILTPDGVNELTILSQKINSYKPIQVGIVGYTDTIGKEDFNLELSKGRAQSVKLFLIQQGIPPSIVVADGYGQQDAVASPLCFTKYGQDPEPRIADLETKLMSKKFKSKHLSKKLKAEKNSLETQLATLKNTRQQLLSCTAGDRRVVITVKHQEQVAAESETHPIPNSNSSATLSVTPILDNESPYPSSSTSDASTDKSASVTAPPPQASDNALPPVKLDVPQLGQ